MTGSEPIIQHNIVALELVIRLCPVQDPWEYRCEIYLLLQELSSGLDKSSNNFRRVEDMLEKRMGALIRRPKTPIRKQRLPQEKLDAHPEIPSLASRVISRRKHGCRRTSFFRDCPITRGGGFQLSSLLWIIFDILK